ncbi:MAG TPA: hypothetical protein VMU07_04255 [Candidatus Paceibacterota bacterium]|nr:hypothetical protein [Candidatus Paceibacterota bacterium]
MTYQAVISTYRALVRPQSLRVIDVRMFFVNGLSPEKADAAARRRADHMAFLAQYQERRKGDPEAISIVRRLARLEGNELKVIYQHPSVKSSAAH